MSTLAEMYLAERGGSPHEFREGLYRGLRIGQAFFNALSGVDQGRLAGTLHDPFHFDGLVGELRVHRAIEHLLDTEPT